VEVRRISLLAVLIVLAVPAAAHADIGIRHVSKSAARPGEPVSVIVAGHLGPGPWRPMPIVMIPAARTPERVRVPGGYSAPLALPSELRPPRYRVVGSVRRWRAVSRMHEHARGRLRFRVPRVTPRRYVFALFCDGCVRGPRGSLIVRKTLVLRVRA
jgi:hypothetical protein